MGDTDRLAARQLLGAADELRVADILVHILGCVDKIALKLVAGPLQSVLYSVGEVFQRARRYGLLGWVVTGRVALRQVRYDYLYVSLGAERT